jgi:hypothetical protein
MTESPCPPPKKKRERERSYVDSDETDDDWLNL